MRTFHVDRSDVAAFVRLSEQEIWPRMHPHRALGLWQVVMGGPERILLLTEYESLAHWQSTRSWERGIEHIPGGERSGLVRDFDVVALRPITRRRPQGDAPEAEPGVYTLRTFHVARENVRRFVEVSEDGWWPWVEAGQRIRPICQWITLVGPQTRIYMMSRYDDLAHWEATRTDGPVPPPGDPLRPLWEKAREAIRERQGLVIDTGVQVLRPISTRRP
jgi:hypothetical protein